VWVKQVFFLQWISPRMHMEKNVWKTDDLDTVKDALWRDLIIVVWLEVLAVEVWPHHQSTTYILIFTSKPWYYMCSCSLRFFDHLLCTSHNQRAVCTVTSPNTFAVSWWTFSWDLSLIQWHGQDVQIELFFKMGSLTLHNTKNAVPPFFFSQSNPHTKQE